LCGKRSNGFPTSSDYYLNRFLGYARNDDFVTQADKPKAERRKPPDKPRRGKTTIAAGKGRQVETRGYETGVLITPKGLNIIAGGVNPRKETRYYPKSRRDGINIKSKDT
jgi:hypothetical protein